MPASNSEAPRLVSLDVFRGVTMFCMFSTGFGLQYFPALAPVSRQFEHSLWQGLTFWDLIQPFFMFIVGAAMPFSFARRLRAGESFRDSLVYVLRRALLLLLCGLATRSFQARRPVFDIINVLGQLAFAYPVAFLTLRLNWRWQATIASSLLATHWALYRFATAPGITGPWDPDANIGWYLDGLLLGTHWGDSFGYATINCVPSAATTIIGVMAGSLLARKNLPPERKLYTLLGAGLGCGLLGLAISPAVPIIKKIWTASFALSSTAFCLFALAWFYWLCDMRRMTGWARIFIIIGQTSLFIYLFHETLGGYVAAAARRGLGLFWNGPWSLFAAAWLTILFHVILCLWWRRRGAPKAQTSGVQSAA